MRVHVEVLSMCVIRYCIVIFYDSSSTAISENKILSWKKELHRNSSAIDWNNIYLLGLSNYSSKNIPYCEVMAPNINLLFLYVCAWGSWADI